MLAALNDTPVVLLRGARQCGKSTLAQQIAATDHPVRYLTLDDAIVLNAIQTDAAGFLAGLDGPVVLDEIQRAPELFVAIKATVDRDRKPGRFLLTGSTNVRLLPKLSESLAGRMEVLTLWPFSEGELAGIPSSFIDAAFAAAPPARCEGTGDVFSRILRGGFPPAVERTDAARRNAWFGSYILTGLERDAREIARIDNPGPLRRMLALAAGRVGTLVNFAEMARGTVLPQTTLKRYFALFEGTFLTVTVPAWSTVWNKRLIKTSKLYLNDTGLAASLLGLTAEMLQRDAVLRGGLLESFVAMELRKQAGWSATKTQLFHFRTASGQEVDFLLESDAGAIVGIEVKASATVTGHDFNGLRALAEMAGSRFHRGIVLYTGVETVAFGANLFALPVDALWVRARSPFYPEVMHISEIDTPALIVDLNVFERNLSRVAEYARTHSLRLRPHSKTHKSVWIGKRQMELGAAGLTVAKVSEAEIMADADPQELLLAFPIVGQAKLARLTEVARRTHVTVALDSVEAARQLSEAASAADVEVGVLAETDVGLGRVGVAPGEPLLALARAIEMLPHLRFEGIAFYPGHIKSLDEAGLHALGELSKLLGRILGDFRRAGIEVRIVSGGSTPALFHSHEIAGLNEIRPGTYVFNDINTVRSGACGMEDCAASILATVVSTARPGHMIIDGGSKTFSSDRPVNSGDVSFGHLVEAPGARFHKMNEEHGFVDLTEAGREFRIGERVHVIPNHVCVAVNLHEKVYGVRGETVERVWAVEARGKLQ